MYFNPHMPTFWLDHKVKKILVLHAQMGRVSSAKSLLAHCVVETAISWLKSTLVIL